MNAANTYRKLVVKEPGPDFQKATAIVEAALPTPAADEVLVRNLYAGVNASDPIAASGGYGATETPFDIGVESAGEVVALGDGIDDLAVGDHVLVFGAGGGYGEYRLARREEALPIRQAGPELTSAFISGMTALVGLEVSGEMGRDETVLVTAAAGGVGSYAVQLAKRAGNHVIGTCSSDEKAQWLRQLGCDRAVNYRSEDLDRVLGEEYPHGINLVFESVGRDTFDTALAHLAVFGRLICIGAVAEYRDGLEWEAARQVRVYRQLLATSGTIRGCYLPHFMGKLSEYLQRLEHLLDSGEIRAMIDPTEFNGVDAIHDAVDHVRQGRNRGKVIIRYN